MIRSAAYNNLSLEQRNIAIQRLTALWAFCESGLGGIMHAFQFPFTGLIVGGMAIIIISFIANLSEKKYSAILQSMLIVLIIKAAVSPHTPFPAYIAVAFQSLLGYILFNLFSVNLVSILLLSVIAMIESAIQKLLVLTLFFGNSLWKAADELSAMITKQLGFVAANGSDWLIAGYCITYCIGGILIALIAYKAIKDMPATRPALEILEYNNINEVATKNNNWQKSVWVAVIILMVISIVLFLVAPADKKVWVDILKTICWTSTVILLWYLLINPLFTKLIHRLLKKKESRYAVEINNVLSFLPELKQLAIIAWKQNAGHNNFKRLYFFMISFFHWSLSYTATDKENNTLKNKA